MLELAIHLVVLEVGAVACFYSGSIARLTEDVALMKPTVFVGVGRVFERIHDGLEHRISQQWFPVRALVRAAIAIKSFCYDKFRMQRVPLVDVVTLPFQRAFGGHLRVMAVGGSAYPGPDQHWLSMVLCVPFVAGYGLTETCLAGALQDGRIDKLRGTVGVPLSSVKEKLRSVPELGYDVRDGVGELLVKGESVSQGYYNCPEETAAAFEDGWFATGDIVRLSPTGQMYIVGRSKDKVKLANGEYVAIPRLHEAYSHASFVSQMYVHAGIGSRFLTAVVVLRPGAQVTEGQVLSEFTAIGDANGFNGFERIKRVHLTYDEWTPENGMLTPSMKLAGHKIAARYARQLDDLARSGS